MSSIPSLQDRHTHVSLYAALQGCPSLADCADVAEALAILRGLPEDQVTTVLGWHSGRLPLKEADLEGLPPILLVSFSLHGLWITPAACAYLREEAPELVAHHRDPDWCERHLPELLPLYARFAGLSAAKLDAFLLELEGCGIGATEDLLLVDLEAWYLIRQSRWADRIACWCAPGLFVTLPSDVQADMAGLKFFTDGAIGTRTAALSEPYLDGSCPAPLWTDGELREALAQAASWGKAVAIHAIGDLALEQALRVLEGLSTAGVRFPSIRLEHVPFIDAAQASRVKVLRAILSMQPNFNADSVDYADRLAPHWLARNNPFRMLIDEAGFVPGVDLIFGSDGMPHGLACAATWSLFPPFPGQRLSLDELVAGFGAAPGGPLEVQVGDGEVHVSNFALGMQGTRRYTDKL